MQTRSTNACLVLQLNKKRWTHPSSQSVSTTCGSSTAAPLVTVAAEPEPASPEPWAAPSRLVLSSWPCCLDARGSPCWLGARGRSGRLGARESARCLGARGSPCRLGARGWPGRLGAHGSTGHLGVRGSPRRLGTPRGAGLGESRHNPCRGARRRSCLRLGERRPSHRRGAPTLRWPSRRRRGTRPRLRGPQGRAWPGPQRRRDARGGLRRCLAGRWRLLRLHPHGRRSCPPRSFFPDPV